MNADICPGADMLQRYVDDDVSPLDRASIDTHLSQCGTCEKLVQSIEDQPHSGLEEFREFARANAPARSVMDSDVAEFTEEPAFVGLQSRLKALRDIPVPGNLGRYDLIEEIGRGGMGTVYRARHDRLNKVVAVKVLSPDRLHAESIARFEREMLAAGSLNHANIVAATDADEFEGTQFLVMEFVDGTDVARLLNANDPLTVPDACEIVRQAAIGLQHAHENGLVHRDIKPSNLMIAKDGSVKILDLGLARLHDAPSSAEALTITGQMMGTVDYMAPEQADDGHSADIRADIYSLGCTLFQLLSGRRPFRAFNEGGPLKILKAHALKPIPSVRDLRRDTPAKLDEIIQRMLAKQPSDRFEEPAAVANVLEAFVAGNDLKAVAARPTHKVNAPGSTALVSNVDTSQPSAVGDAETGMPSIPSAPDETQASRLSGRAKVIVGLIAVLLVAGWFYNIERDKNGGLTVEFRFSSDEAVVHKESPKANSRQQLDTEFESLRFEANESWTHDKGGYTYSDEHGESWLVSSERYSNFVLEFEALAGEQSGTGVAFRLRDNVDPVATHVPSFVVNSDPGHSPPVWSTGALHSWLRPKSYVSSGPDTWHHARLEATDGRIRFWLNDTLLQDFEIADCLALRTHLPELFSSSGHIAIRGRDAGTRIRDIRIQRLPDGTTEWLNEIPDFAGSDTSVHKPVPNQVSTWKANDPLRIPYLRAYWSFNEGQGRLALDGTEYLNHGWLDGSSNSVQWSDDAAPTQYYNPSALQFLQDGRVDVGPIVGPEVEPAELIGNQGTFSVWLKTNQNRAMCLWGITNKDDSTEAGLILNEQVENRTLGVWMWYRGTDPDRFYGHGIDPSVCDGKWHHIAVTWNDASSPQTRFYIDGAIQERRQFNGGSQGWPVEFSRFDTSLRLGCWTHAATEKHVAQFEGLMDEVRFYSVALDDARVTQLATGTTPE